MNKVNTVLNNRESAHTTQIRASRLTRLEVRLADQNPARVEVELQLDEAADAMRYRDDGVARELHQRVPHVVVLDGVRGVVDAPDAEVEPRHAEDAHVLAEHVVAMHAHAREVAHVCERQDDLDRRPIDRVVLPADPLVALVVDAGRRHAEVLLAGDAVDELSEAARQTVVSLRAVVGEVEKVDVSAAPVALGETVGEEVGCGAQCNVE